MVVSCRQIHTAVVHLTEVRIRRTDEARLRRDGVTLHEDVAAQLLEEVHLQVKVVIQSQLKAHVRLAAGLPCQVRNAHFSFLHTGVIDIALVTPVIAARIGIDSSQVGKTARTADIVITHQTNARAQLQLTQHLTRRLHPVLLRHQPTYRSRREETETLPLGEVLRTVVAKVELEHIAAVVGVRCTTCDTLVAVWLRAAVVVRTQVIEQQGIHRMLIRKSLIVGYRSLEIEAVAAVLRIIAMPQELRAVFQDRVHQVTLIITTARRAVVVRRLAAGNVGLRIVVVRERYFRAQTRGDELQVLLYGEQALYLAARAAVVTVLRTHRPRVIAVGRSQGYGTIGIDGRVHKRRGLEGFLKHLIRARVALAQHLQVTTHIKA